VFEITAMGPAGIGLESEIPRLLGEAGLSVLEQSVQSRASSGGRYGSVKLSFRARDRAEYEAAHTVLRNHPEVKWTL